jgi:biofilm PGA synthesis protein PgaA
LLHQAGRNSEIGQLTDQDHIQKVADYAYMSWAAGLRDIKRFAEAQRILAPVRIRLGVKAEILYAMVSAEAHQIDIALAALPVSNTKLDADDYAHMAYVYRLAGRSSDELQMSLRARDSAPDSSIAIQESVTALTNLTAPYAAYQLALKSPQSFPKDMLNWLRVNVTAQNLRDAVAERSRLDGLNKALVRNQPLDDVLVEINKNISDIPESSPQHLRSLFDRVYALRMRGRMLDAITAYQSLPITQTPTPNYVQHAAADAYAATHQSQKAIELYEPLLVNSAAVPLYLGYYDALIEREDYERASNVLKMLKRVTPVSRRSGKVGGNAIPNWERLEVDQSSAMNAAYRNQMAEAEQDFATLAAHAPHNSGILNNYATVLRWRDLPEKADAVTALAAAYEPDSAMTQLGIAKNAEYLDQIPRWRKVIVPLQQEFPDDPNIQKNYAELKDRDRPSMTSEFSIGDSSGGHHVNDINGSRDREWVTRVNTPWVMDDWRGFVQEGTRWADLGAENAHDNRMGLGVEWSNNRRDAWLLVSGQAAGSHASNKVGVSGGWSQWVNDHWQYSLTSSSNSEDIPLRALNDGLSASSFGVGLKWQQNESRSAHLNLGLMDISDGDHRQTISIGMMQRLFAGPRYTTIGACKPNCVTAI